MKKIVLLFSLFMLLNVIAFAKTSVVAVDKAVAVIGTEPILASEFNEIAGPMIGQYKKMDPNIDERKLKENILTQMVNEKLLLQEAEKRKIKIPKTKRKEALSKVKTRFKNEKEFKGELKQRGLTQEEFEGKIVNELTLLKLINQIESGVEPPTDKEAKKYYNEHESEMRVPERVKARHILVSVKDNASKKEQDKALTKIKSLKAKLDKGANFAELATEHSDCPSKARGGDLGMFMRGDMVKEFEDVAFSLKVGQVSDIVKTKFGYHIILCEEKGMQKKYTFDEIQGRIKQILFDLRVKEEIDNLIKKLKTEINVKINLENLD